MQGIIYKYIVKCPLYKNNTSKENNSIWTLQSIYKYRRIRPYSEEQSGRLMEIFMLL